MIVLNEYDLMHEAFLSKKSRGFNGRLNGPVQLAYCDAKEGTPSDMIGGIGVSTGNIWKLNRKLVYHSLLSKHRLSKLKHILIDEIEYMVDHLESSDNNEIDISSVLMKTSSNFITMSGFGCRLYSLEHNDNGGDSSEQKEQIFTYADVGSKESYLRFLSKYPSNHLLKYYDNVSFIRSILEEIFEDYKNSKNNGLIDSIPLMDTLIQHQEDGVFKDNASVVTLMLDILLAGSDSTYKTLSFIVLLLIKHPECQQKLYDEIKDLKVKDISDIDLTKLKYMEAVVYEAMRLYPAAPLALPHVCTESQKLGGYKIEKDSILVPNIFSLHRDENVWVEPEVFNPDRFMENPSLLNSSSLAPFGIGQRSCIGKNFALLEIKLTLASIISKFHLEKIGNDCFEIEEGMYNFFFMFLRNL